MSTIHEHGDTPFMPSGWWHHIEYLEGGFGLALHTMANSQPVLSKGLGRLSFLRVTDNIARKVNDKKWFDYKKTLVRERADRALSRLRSRCL